MFLIYFPVSMSHFLPFFRVDRILFHIINAMRPLRGAKFELAMAVAIFSDSDGRDIADDVTFALSDGFLF